MLAVYTELSSEYQVINTSAISLLVGFLEAQLILAFAPPMHGSYVCKHKELYTKGFF